LSVARADSYGVWRFSGLNDVRLRPRLLAALLLAILVSFVSPRHLSAAPVAAAGSNGGGVTAPDDGVQQDAVQTRMTELVSSSIRAFFRKMNLPLPELIDVSTHATFDRATGLVAQLDLKVTLTTDQMPAVVREARQELMRVLVAHKYRFDAAPVGAREAQPLVVLSLDAVPPQGQKNMDQPRLQNYLILGLMALGTLLGFALTLALLRRPFTADRRLAKTGLRPAETTAARAGGGAPSAHLPSGLPPLPNRGEGPTLDLPPLPSEAASQGGTPQTFPAREHGSTHPMPAAALSQLTLGPRAVAMRAASEDTLRQAFDQLPLEKALELLADVDDATRVIVMDKLQLSASIRQRLEKELATRAKGEPRLV